MQGVHLNIRTNKNAAISDYILQIIRVNFDVIAKIVLRLFFLSLFDLDGAPSPQF